MKQKTRFIILFALGFFFPFLFVSASTNPYAKTTSWGDVNCTWMAWQQTYDRTGIALPGFGNARDWYNDAKNAGFSVGSEPKANSIIVLDNYLEYGHVAFVDHTNNGVVYVWDSKTCYREMTDEEYALWRDCIKNNTTNEQDEYLCDSFKVMEETTCEYSKENGKLENVIGYIYVTEPRETPSTSTNQNSSSSSSFSTTNDNSTPVVKSSNNFLKELKIEEIPFAFDKETLEYSLDVEYEVDHLRITALQEDETSTIEMEEEVDLEVGANPISILVTAEDSSVREYKLTINRLEKAIMEEDDFEEVEKTVDTKEEKNLSFLSWSILGIFCLFIVGILVFIWIRKKGKNDCK